MISWDYCGDRLITVFSPRQVRWLRRQLTDYQSRLDSALCGNRVDPALGVVLANLSGGLDYWLKRARSTAAMLLGDLPDCGGVIEMVDVARRVAWVWILQEIRILVSAQLGVSVGDASVKLDAWLAEIVETVAVAGDFLFVSDGLHDSHFLY
ncbi:hypothetical protein LWC34_45910 [Kibdelosporangium philippinense]|uniref:Uncharacterized protein n=1 Tax=Kibdelosporangium philippinense TaxID=211113 RepID=A0ABS8ZS83_9PSEU|nr:hypothetical protein [Kibdelosporangium philippinense]MCE7010093.1 hypothetical protein [Kibdelosporangium philippinense]